MNISTTKCIAVNKTIYKLLKNKQEELTKDAGRYIQLVDVTDISIKAGLIHVVLDEDNRITQDVPQTTMPQTTTYTEQKRYSNFPIRQENNPQIKPQTDFFTEPETDTVKLGKLKQRRINRATYGKETIATLQDDIIDLAEELKIMDKEESKKKTIITNTKDLNKILTNIHINKEEFEKVIKEFDGYLTKDDLGSLDQMYVYRIVIKDKGYLVYSNINKITNIYKDTDNKGVRIYSYDENKEIKCDYMKVTNVDELKLMLHDYLNK